MARSGLEMATGAQEMESAMRFLDDHTARQAASSSIR